MRNIAIIGAGIVGRLAGYYLRQAGHQVSIYESSSRYSEGACSYVAAGLLTPRAEAANGDPALSRLGIAGMPYWQDLARVANNPDLIDISGSVTVSYRDEPAEYREFERRLIARGFSPSDTSDGREPAFEQDHLVHHVIEGEGRVNTKAFMIFLLQCLEDSGVALFFSESVLAVRSGEIDLQRETKYFDTVLDCRGLGAQSDAPDLRGVRGETILLYAPEVHISRPVRVLHHRYPVYIVPRPNHEYLVGATSIESEDNSSITVRSALDLLNGVYNLHHGFRYAHLVKTAAACRPAYSDNLPRIDWCDGLMRINGLYRHGYLLGPLFAHTAKQIIEKEETLSEMQPYIKNLNDHQDHKGTIDGRYC